MVNAIGLCAATSIGIGAFSIWALSWDTGMFLFLLGVVVFYSLYQFLNMFILAAAAFIVRQSPLHTTAGFLMLTLAFIFYVAASYLVWTWFEWSGFDGFIKRFAVTVLLVRGIQGIVYGSLFTAKEIK